MSERSSFWTSGSGDGPVGGDTQQNILEWLRDSFTSDRYASEGVLAGTSSELAVTGTSGASPSVTVAAGAAYVYGFYYQNTASLVLSVTKPSVGTTGGRVVLRADWTARTVRGVVKLSADGTSAIPALTQTASTTWEITLATFTVTTGGTITVTDGRDYCHPTALVYRRQGGSATDWSTAGTTTYTPGGTKIQVGAIGVTFSSSGSSNATTVTFPSAYSQVPLVFVTTFANGSTTPRRVLLTVDAITTTTCDIRGFLTDGATTSSTITAWWFAIGAE